MDLDLKTSCRFVRGVGPARAEVLRGAGIHTVEDLLYYLPFRYEDRRRFARIVDLRPGGKVTIRARIRNPRVIYTRRRGFVILRAVLADPTGEIPAVWYNQPFLRNVLREGRMGAFFGEARFGRGRTPKLVFENPRFEILSETESGNIHSGRVVPIYQRIDPLSPRTLRQIFQNAIQALTRGIPDPVPVPIRRRYCLMDREKALREVHFPTARDLGPYQEGTSSAHRRLLFEEMYFLQLGLLLQKRDRLKERRGRTYQTSVTLRRKLQDVLPYRLTPAQRRTLREIFEDLRRSHPMNRLLQGEVGSGKTIVALLSMLMVIENGYQATLMAPTGILAEQHFLTIQRYLRGKGYRVGLLTSAVKGRQRSEILEGIASGAVPLVIGTHSLLQEEVRYRDLALVVIDEQHRFGVLQRGQLREKADRPDILVMTATPIPRSLALTVYGDLDLSVIDELPPGRLPVRTFLREEEKREAIYRFIRKRSRQGRQTYIVTPRLEETDRSDLRAARSLATELSEGPFRGIPIALLHGGMSPEEKEAAMVDFAEGRVSVLVATTVIEVGIDVPRATVILIENSERFGLSQLHQLRGRVGRGTEGGACILLMGRRATPESRRRLRILVESTDGFSIAEADLEQRGPGELLGFRQSGIPEIWWSRILRNRDLLEEARRAARETVFQSPDPQADHSNLFRFVEERWPQRYGRIQVG